MNFRLKLLREELLKLKLDGMIVTNLNNIYYLIGIKNPGFLVVSKTEAIYFTSEKYISEAEKNMNIYSEAILKSVEKNSNLLNEIFSEQDNVAVESRYITLKEFDDAKKTFKTNFTITDKIVEKIREVKEESEIEKIKEVSLDISKIFENIEYLIKPHISELEIQSEILKEAEKRKLEITNIKVLSGENTSDIYKTTGFRRLNKEDILIVDITAKKNMYHSSMARTFFIGDFKNKYNDAYENYTKIYRVQDKMLKILKKHNNISDIYQEIKKDLENINWNIDYYVASGIGINETEEPEFKVGNYTNIRKGMVLKINPQIYYFEKYGIILKDTIVITDANFIFLTKYEKREVDEIKF